MHHAITLAPDHVHFGVGSRHGIAAATALYGRRAAIIADPFLAGTPEFTDALSALEGAGIATTVSTEVVPELPVGSVTAAAEAIRGFSPDVVIGYGGGSALDLAKLVALLLRHPGPLSQYYGENLVPGPVLPLIAVPTTAGTGSEVTPVAVIADPDRELKVGISDAALIPRVAIVDPDLTVGAPPAVTAHSGIDALVHAIEAITAREREPEWSNRLPVFIGRNRLSTLLGLDAVRSISGSIEAAVADGSDREARKEMAYGSLTAGLAFGTAGTHLSHALQYPIGAMTHTPHGLGTGLMLPYVLSACYDTSIEELADIGHAMGVTETDAGQRADAVIHRVAEIRAAIGIPHTLAEIGLARTDLPRIVDLALGVTRLAGNATRAATPDLLTSILTAAFDGELERRS